MAHVQSSWLLQGNQCVPQRWTFQRRSEPWGQIFEELWLRLGKTSHTSIRAHSPSHSQLKQAPYLAAASLWLHLPHYPPKKPLVSTLSCLKTHLQRGGFEWAAHHDKKPSSNEKRNSRGVNKWICTDAFKVRQLKIDCTYGCCKTFPLTVGLQWAYCEWLPLIQLVKHQLPLRLIHPTCLKSHVGQTWWKNTVFSLLAARCSLGGMRFSSGHKAAVKEKS